MKVWLPAVRAGSGSDVYVRRLAAALPRHGVEATVTWLPHWLELLPALARMQPPPGTTLIHANSWNAFAFARFGIPLVSTVHLVVHAPEALPHKSQAQRLYHEVLIRRYEAASCRRAAATVAVSAAAAQATAAAFPGVRPVTIHNWVDTALFVPAPSSPDRAARPFRLLFAGNGTARKGWDLLAPLMGRLGDAFHLTIAAGLRGDVPAEQLPPHATSLGPVRDERRMVRAYQECDAVVMPSRLEGFGYVAAEAMACGKPVVAFDNSSLPELVADGETGFLVPTDDVEALADRCRQLAGDTPRRARMGEAARSAALQRFSEDAALPRYVGLYGRLAP